jgi:hypothetical protein
LREYNFTLIVKENGQAFTPDEGVTLLEQEDKGAATRFVIECIVKAEHLGSMCPSVYTKTIRSADVSPDDKSSVARVPTTPAAACQTG